MILKFRVYEQTISLQATKSEPRQGSKEYLELQFLFSPDWNDLLKYVYLQHGEVSVPHDLVEGSVIVDEYFTEQAEFNVTLFGKSADGSIEVPTNVVTVFLKESNNLWVKDAPEPQNSWFVQVADARDEALAAAIRAENAAIHQPYPNEETGTWWVWSAETGKYEDTGESYGVSVTHSWNGTVLTVTSASGTSSADLKGDKGDTGATGKDGATGADGKTPVKGTDYFTNADKQEIAEAAAELVDVPTTLPTPNKLTFTGAVNAEFDGSEAVTVEIPSGGSGVTSWNDLTDKPFGETRVTEDIYGPEELALKLSSNETQSHVTINKPLFTIVPGETYIFTINEVEYRVTAERGGNENTIGFRENDYLPFYFYYYTTPSYERFSVYSKDPSVTLITFSIQRLISSHTELLDEKYLGPISWDKIKDPPVTSWYALNNSPFGYETETLLPETKYTFDIYTTGTIVGNITGEPFDIVPGDKHIVLINGVGYEVEAILYAGHASMFGPDNIWHIYETDTPGTYRYQGYDGITEVRIRIDHVIGINTIDEKFLPKAEVDPVSWDDLENKPFEESINYTEVLPRTTFVLDHTDGTTTYGTYELDLSEQIVFGAKYRITVPGVALYNSATPRFEVVDDRAHMQLNASYQTVYLRRSSDNPKVWTIVSNDKRPSLDISIERVDTAITKIPDKYLPNEGKVSWDIIEDRPFGFFKDKHPHALLEETVVTLDQIDDLRRRYNSIPVKSKWILPGVDRYTVVWNGVEYEFEYTDAEQTLIGAASAADVDKYPFCLTRAAGSTEWTVYSYDVGMESVTVAMYYHNDYITKIDPMYLPDLGVRTWGDLEGKPFSAKAGETILSESGFAIAQEFLGLGTLPGSSLSNIVSGNRYLVTYNGVDYPCTAVPGEMTLAVPTLGSFKLTGISLGNASGGPGDPFSILILDADSQALLPIGAGVIKVYDGSSEGTIAIHEALSVTAIPSGYVPKPSVSWNDLLDKPFSGSAGGSEVFPEAALTFEDMMCPIADTIPLEIGKEYTVVWNGVEYPCTGVAFVEDGVERGVALGNLDAMTGTGDSGHPFLVASVYPEFIEEAGGIPGLVVALDGSTTATISISSGGKLVPLDPMYLPEVDSFIMKSSTAGSTKRFRVTVDDNGTLSAVEVTE